VRCQVQSRATFWASTSTFARTCARLSPLPATVPPNLPPPPPPPPLLCYITLLPAEGQPLGRRVHKASSQFESFQSFIHVHHSIEEQRVFPVIRKK